MMPSLTLHVTRPVTRGRRGAGRTRALRVGRDVVVGEVAVVAWRGRRRLLLMVLLLLLFPSRSVWRAVSGLAGGGRRGRGACVDALAHVRVLDLGGRGRGYGRGRRGRGHDGPDVARGPVGPEGGRAVVPLVGCCVRPGWRRGGTSIAATTTVIASIASFERRRRRGRVVHVGVEVRRQVGVLRGRRWKGLVRVCHGRMVPGCGCSVVIGGSCRRREVGGRGLGGSGSGRSRGRGRPRGRAGVASAGEHAQGRVVVGHHGPRKVSLYVVSLFTETGVVNTPTS